LLIDNLLLGWPTLTQVVGKSTEAGTDDLRRVASLLITAFGGGTEEGVANSTQAVLVAAGIPTTLLLLTTGPGRGEVRSSQRRAAWSLLLAGGIDLAAAHNAVRHLVPAALIGYVLVGAALALLGERLKAGRLLIGAVLVFGVLLPNAWQTGLHPQQEFGDEVPRASEVQTVIRALEARQLHSGYSDYWSAYPITFGTSERVVVAPVLPVVFGGRLDRYPAYTQMVDAIEDPAGLFVLVDERCTPSPFVQPLEQHGARYKVEHVSRWYLIWGVEAPDGAAPETLRAWRHTVWGQSSCH
jgi:hypothetical protein